MQHYDASATIDAPPEQVWAMITDVTRMGEWSPETVRCEWRDEPGKVGSTFKGSNRNGLMRWSTVARVEVADRPREFTFATIFRGSESTRWSYRLDGDGPTRLTESFESVHTPWLIGVAERLVIRDRQGQLEQGLDETLARIKAAAEAAS